MKKNLKRLIRGGSASVFAFWLCGAAFPNDPVVPAFESPSPGYYSIIYLMDMETSLRGSIVRNIESGKVQGYPSGISHIKKVSRSKGKPPGDVRLAGVEWVYLTKDGTRLFPWERYQAVEIWENPITGLEAGPDRWLIGIGWVEGKPELIECLHQFRKVGQEPTGEKMVPNPHRMLEDEESRNRALKYVLEMDQLLVRSVHGFLSKDGEKPYPSGIEWLYRVDREGALVVYQEQGIRVKVRILDREGGLFDVSEYHKIELWKRPLGELSGVVMPCIGIGWQKNDGRPELIEASLSVEY